MGTIKDINGRDLVDTGAIRKRWKEYMEELYKKYPDELYDSSGVVSHPEPDFGENEVKWALGSTAVNKVSGCDGIPVELFRSLNNDAIKVSKSGRHSSGHRTGKGQSSSQYSRKVSHTVMSNSFVTPQTVARQSPSSKEFPRQGYWSGLPFPSLGDLPDPRI